MAAAAYLPPQFESASGQSRDQRRIGQVLSASALALGVTLCLFTAMERMIRVEKITVAPKTDFTMTDFLLDEPVLEEPSTFLQDDIIEAPPPPAAPDITRPRMDTGSVPSTTFSAPPPEIPSSLDELTFTPLAYSGPMEAIPIKPPRATYPRRALQMGLSGSCEVGFSVTAAGEPFNLSAVCSNDAFKAAAIRAVSKAQFSPGKTEEGVPVVTHNLVFPIEFRLSE